MASAGRRSDGPGDPAARTRHVGSMTPRTNGQARFLCALGGHSDELFVLREAARSGESMPASARSVAGGCAHNVAAGLAALGHRVAHAGIRGRDPAGATVARSLAERGVADLALERPDLATGRYVAMLEPDGTLALAAAAMDAYDHAIDLADHAPFRAEAEEADAIVLDANGSAEAVHALARRRGSRTRLVLLATSARKVPSIASLVTEADLVLANAAEWRRLLDLSIAPPALALVTAGAEGAVAYRDGRRIAARTAPIVDLADVIGAGDAFGAGALSAWIAGERAEAVLDSGLECAARCVAADGPLGWLDREGEDAA